MTLHIILSLAVSALYIGTSLYFTHVHRTILRKEGEMYKKVFEETMQLLADRQVRSSQRIQILHAIDWAHARRTHGDLRGLPFILPGKIMESAEPIDVTKYFTDDEAEIVIEGLEIFEKDKRTAHLCRNFIVR